MRLSENQIGEIENFAQWRNFEEILFESFCDASYAYK